MEYAEKEKTRKRCKSELHAGPAASPLEKFENLSLLECISSILEQKLECVNRTQTSLNFGFLGSNFQRKVGY